MATQILNGRAVGLWLLSICLLGGLVGIPARGSDEPPAAQPSQQPQRKLIRLEQLPPVTTDNTSALIEQYRPRLVMSASSTWSGWPMENAIDGQVKTSWFSGEEDSAAKGKQPWIQTEFPENITVRRVTVLGNRDPEWLDGYTILAAKVELYDAKDMKLRDQASEGTGNYRDFDFRFKQPITGVRKVRFISIWDQGSHNPYGDIAIAELQVE